MFKTARSTRRNTGTPNSIARIFGFGRRWWISWVESLRLSARLPQNTWSRGAHIARPHQNKTLPGHASNPIPRNNARRRSRVCNSSCRAQASPNCRRYYESPNRMRRSAGCQRSSHYRCLDMTVERAFLHVAHPTFSIDSLVPTARFAEVASGPKELNFHSGRGRRTLQVRRVQRVALADSACFRFSLKATT